MPDLLPCEVDVGLDQDRISRHVLDGAVWDGGDAAACAGVEDDGAWGGGEVLQPAGCIVVQGEGLACEATLGATAAESGGSEGRDQAGRIPLINGYGAVR